MTQSFNAGPPVSEHAGIMETVTRLSRIKSLICPRCYVTTAVSELLDGEACPNCKLVIPVQSVPAGV